MGRMLKPAAELDAPGMLGQVLAHNEQVRDALIAFALEVMLGHPQDVETKIVQEHGGLTGNVESHRQPIIVVPAVVCRHAVKSDAVALKHVASVKNREIFNHCHLLLHGKVISPWGYRISNYNGVTPANAEVQSL